MKLNVTYILLTFIAGTVAASAQAFNLMAAKASDKVAQSSYFVVSHHSIQLFESTNFNQPSATVTGDTMIVARVPRATTFVGEKPATVTTFVLDQNYPNPFNMSTVIRFSLPEQARVTIKVFDLTGKEIATVVNETKSAGTHSVGFGNNFLSSGTYFYRMIAQTGSGQVNIETKKMIVMK